MRNQASFSNELSAARERYREIISSPDNYSTLEGQLAIIDLDVLEGLHGIGARAGYRSRLVAHRGRVVVRCQG